MPDGVQIRIRRDSVSPDLKRLVAMGGDMTPLMRAIGVGIVSLSKRAFNDPSLRPNSWAAKKDGSAATLKRDAVLWRSITVGTVTRSNVTVKSDRAYSAIHQLGGKTRPIPRRGFMPFDENGKITARGDKLVKSVIKTWVDKRGAVV